MGTLHKTFTAKPGSTGSKATEAITPIPAKEPKPGVSGKRTSARGRTKGTRNQASPLATLWNQVSDLLKVCSRHLWGYRPHSID